MTVVAIYLLFYHTTDERCGARCSFVPPFYMCVFVFCFYFSCSTIKLANSSCREIDTRKAYARIQSNGLYNVITSITGFGRFMTLVEIEWRVFLSLLLFLSASFVVDPGFVSPIELNFPFEFFCLPLIEWTWHCMSK